LILLFELGQALGRISAFALIKLHPRMPFRSRKKYAGAACVAAAKNPVQSSRPGSSRSFGEYALLEDSRYMSQESYLRRDCYPQNPRYFRGLPHAADATPARVSWHRKKGSSAR
jgi:hypothetical protein